ncbi:PIN domain-containing protein [Ruficoccus amylovorans]|uniref:PIN domain-containing protein n=1 Tax=Ruficoccus amylovorans TaxID=1804625 RepID=A0A842HGJ0_9BACT|nr:PIN domain-containing protein [Ruficoccus amylovorans]MBC2595643.1 PIN domain-containing protein [Ruficoccus amylovorans]
MRILVDTDVLLDVALAREAFVEASAAVLQWVDDGGEAAIAWHSIANCSYLLKSGGRNFLEMLLNLVEVAPVASDEARRALALPMSDLEDAMQASAALAWKADYIITRNLPDYRNSPVKAITPTAFLELAT